MTSLTDMSNIQKPLYVTFNIDSFFLMRCLACLRFSSVIILNGIELVPFFNYIYIAGFWQVLTRVMGSHG